MGFPGRLAARVRYALLPGGVFDIRMEAETDAPTLCNLAHHSYFNLAGRGAISDHLHIEFVVHLEHPKWEIDPIHWLSNVHKEPLAASTRAQINLLTKARLME